jgi:hypothetical protein
MAVAAITHISVYCRTDVAAITHTSVNRVGATAIMRISVYCGGYPAITPVEGLHLSHMLVEVVAAFTYTSVNRGGRCSFHTHWCML